MHKPYSLSEMACTFFRSIELMRIRLTRDPADALAVRAYSAGTLKRRVAFARSEPCAIPWDGTENDNIILYLNNRTT